MSKRAVHHVGSLAGVGVLAVLILYPLATLLAQIVFPHVFSVQASFRPSLAPIRSALQNPLDLAAVTNSIASALGGALLAGVLGCITAFSGARAAKSWRAVLDVSVWLILFAPSFVIAQGWVVLMQEGGVAAQIFGLHGNWSSWFFTRFGLALVMGFKYFPYVHIAMVQGIRNLGDEWATAGRTSGASPMQVFWRITLPLMTPALLAGLSIAFAEGFGDFGFAAAITPETHIPLVTYQIYQALATAPVDYPSAAFLSMVLILFTAGALWMQFWWTGRRSYASVNSGTRVAPKPGIPRVVHAAAAGIIGGALVLPIGGSLLVSLWRVWTNGIQPGNWTLAHYGRELNWASSGMHALSASLLYGLIAALVTSSLALFLGYQLTFRTSSVNRLINLIAMASLAIPGVVLAAGFIFAWNASWMHALHVVIYGTPLCLTLAYIAGSVPYAIRLQYGAMSQISPNLLTAAALLGAKPWRVVATVVLPLVSTTALSTFFLTFTHTIFELPASMMLYPPGMPTFAVAAEEQFSQFNWSRGSALTIIGMVVVLAAFLVGQWVIRRVARKSVLQDVTQVAEREAAGRVPAEGLTG